MTPKQILDEMMVWIHDNKNPKAVVTATPADMEMDSIDQIELTLHLEDNLDVTILETWFTDELKEKSFEELATMLSNKLTE